MRITFRAAAWTAAAIGLCAAGLAGPSIASQSDAAPSVLVADHGGAALTAGSFGLNDFSEPALPPVGADADAPFAAHADAPALPIPSAPEPEQAERASRSLAELVSDYSGTETPDEESECLARAVYWESKGEPLSGQLTVAEVVINRAESGRFASTICGVVRQPSQFSFVRRGHIPAPPRTSRDWRVAVAIARIAMQELAEGGAPGALFFHARRVNPGWRLRRVATIGNHVFYR